MLHALSLCLFLLPQDPPPQVEWQRSLADALAVQQATKKPLLLCVNQDGEVFCDRFAAETYRDPAFIATTRGWVCLVASPDRHNERDYDSLGRRIECPRFPGLTCAEHINVEPGLFARWFDGQRTAPRHIGVGVDGKKMFDRFLDRSMQTAIDLVKQRGAEAGSAALPPTPEALLLRRDARARAAFEQRLRRADRLGRLALLELAGKAGNEPFDALRMGLRDDDAAVFAAAADALAKTATKDALIDLQDALARCDDAALAARLVAAIQRVAADAEPARQYAAHRAAALAAAMRAEREPFASAMRATPATPEALERSELEARLDAAERAAKQDGSARNLLAIAQAALALARHLAPSGDSTVPLLFDDARRAAERALAGLGGDDPLRVEAEAVQAIARWQQGDAAAARQHAGNALELAQRLGAPVDASPPWFGECCGAGARAAAQAFYAAIQQDPATTAPETVAAAALPFRVLAGHPAATADDVRAAAQFFAFAGARQLAQQLLWQGIVRMPWSRELHEDYRLRILADRGPEALRQRYGTYVGQAGDEATARWFAGYAAIVAAETLARDKRDEAAREAYGDCIDQFRKSAEANAAYADTANHFAVLALASRALLRHLAGDAAGAVDDLRRARELRPASMGEPDGLGRKPEAIWRRVERELREQGKTDLADRLAG